MHIKQENISVLASKYFDTYGRAEPIRMALWKAGVEFNDNRVTGDVWKAFKESGKLPFGSMPALEFED